MIFNLVGVADLYLQKKILNMYIGQYLLGRFLLETYSFRNFPKTAVIVADIF